MGQSLASLAGHGDTPEDGFSATLDLLGQLDFFELAEKRMLSHFVKVCLYR